MKCTYLYSLLAQTFSLGKKSNDPTSPDYVPTIFQYSTEKKSEYDQPSSSSCSKKRKSLERYGRAVKRRKKAEEMVPFESTEPEIEPEIELPQPESYVNNKGVCSLFFLPPLFILRDP